MMHSSDDLELWSRERNRFGSRADPMGSWDIAPRAKSAGFSIGYAISALAVSLLIYGFIISVAFLLERNGFAESKCLAIIHFGSIASLLAFWRLGRWRRARFDCFGAVLLLLTAALRFQALIDALFFGTRVEEIYIFRSVPMPEDTFLLFLKAESIALIGVLLVSCAWRLRVRSRVESHSFLLNVREVPIKLPVLVYATALVIEVLIRVMGIQFGALTMFSTTLFVIGVACIYFVATRKRGRWGRVFVAIAMGLPMTALALNKGMKSEMFFPLIPAAVILWSGFRGLFVRSVLISAAVAVLSISQHYVHYVRMIAWHSYGIEKVSPVVLVSGFMKELPSIRMVDALDSASSRVNLTVTHAITVTLADRNGFEPGNIFGPIPATFIPRFIWPDKPVLQPGAMQTARILGVDTPISEIRSATAAGFMTELYLGGWWIGVVLGALAYGVLMATAQDWALRKAPGFGQLAFSFLAAYWAFRFGENHVVYAYTAVIFFVAFLFLLKRLATMFGLKMSVGRQVAGFPEARQ